MVDLNNCTSAASAAFLNWGIYDIIDRKGLKGAALKVSLAVGAYAIRVGMHPQTPASIRTHLQILAATTALCSVTSAAVDLYRGRLAKTTFKLGVGIVALTGLCLSVMPKEEVATQLLTYTKFGCYAGAAILSAWSLKDLFTGYRANDVELLKGGIETAAIVAPALGVALALRASGY
ncbi:MAG: hypothetical protein JSS30_07560 [Verrucomicrobia bacterium]|nr:hypothetical protein [Verrucomicrobiota bacterium]